MIQSVNHASQVWNRGTAGKGVTVAVLGSGVDASHPDLSDHVVAFKDFVNGRTEAYDDVGQGTHVAGCIVGGGPTTGSMPEAKLIAVKVADSQGDVSCDRLSQGIEWVLDNRGTLQASVLSLPPLDNDAAVEKSIRKAIDAGMTVVQAFSGPAEPADDYLVIGSPSAKVDIYAPGINLLHKS